MTAAEGPTLRARVGTRRVAVQVPGGVRADARIELPPLVEIVAAGVPQAIVQNSGPAGPPGPQGPQGPAGTGINVKGTVATASQLPEDASTGDGWITEDDGHLHVFDGVGWVDAGEIRGPEGKQGERGEQGEQGGKGDKGDRGDPGADGVTPGGATNQVLSKRSDADGDAAWTSDLIGTFATDTHGVKVGSINAFLAGKSDRTAGQFIEFRDERNPQVWGQLGYNGSGQLEFGVWNEAAQKYAIVWLVGTDGSVQYWTPYNVFFGIRMIDGFLGDKSTRGLQLDQLELEQLGGGGRHTSYQFPTNFHSPAAVGGAVYLGAWGTDWNADGVITVDTADGGLSTNARRFVFAYGNGVGNSDSDWLRVPPVVQGSSLQECEMELDYRVRTVAPGTPAGIYSLIELRLRLVKAASAFRPEFTVHIEATSRINWKRDERSGSTYQGVTFPAAGLDQGVVAVPGTTAPGAQLPGGTVGAMVFQGEWKAGTAYPKGSVVLFLRRAFVATWDNTPGVSNPIGAGPSFWMPLDTNDTGWNTFQVTAAGFNPAGDLAYRRLNGVVYWRGQINGSFTTANQVMGVVPVGFRGSGSYVLRNLGTTRPEINGRSYIVNSSGSLTIAASAATSSVYLDGLGGYAADW